MKIGKNFKKFVSKIRQPESKISKEKIDKIDSIEINKATIKPTKHRQHDIQSKMLLGSYKKKASTKLNVPGTTRKEPPKSKLALTNRKSEYTCIYSDKPEYKRSKSSLSITDRNKTSDQKENNKHSNTLKNTKKKVLKVEINNRDFTPIVKKKSRISQDNKSNIKKEIKCVTMDLKNEIELAASNNVKEISIVKNNDLYEDLKQVVSIESDSSSDFYDEDRLNEDEFKKIKMLIPKIKHCYCIFGFKIHDVLFNSEVLEFNIFKSKIKDFFILSDSEADLLCRYLFSSEEHLIGEYTPFQDDIIDMITLEFMYCFKSSHDRHKKQFIKDLRLLCKCDNISPIDIHNLVCFSEVNLNSHYLNGYLCRESNSMTKITPEAIESLISKLTSRHKKFENLKAIPKRLNSLKNTIKFESHELLKQASDSPPEVNAEKLQKLLLRFSDFLFESNLTLNDIIYPKVWYKVIDGFEYQLINIDHFKECLENVHFPLSDSEMICVEKFCEMPLDNTIKIKSIAKFLEELGIKEKIPDSNKYMNYSTLDSSNIRLFNKIINYIDTHDIDSIESFVGTENIEYFEVISQKKTEKIKIIRINKLRDILWAKGLFPYGQDLDDRFCDFLSISLDENFDELIMIRKLSKAIKDVRSCEFFKRMGVERITYEDIMSSVPHLESRDTSVMKNKEPAKDKRDNYLRKLREKSKTLKISHEETKKEENANNLKANKP